MTSGVEDQVAAGVEENLTESGPVWRRSRDAALRRLLALGDIVALACALVAALTIAGRPGEGSRLLWGLASLPFMIVLFKIYGLYDRDVKRISHSTVDDLPWLLHATIVGTLLLWLYAKQGPLGRLDFEEVTAFGVTTIVLVMTARFLVRQLSAEMLDAEHALLVGDGPAGGGPGVQAHGTSRVPPQGRGRPRA